MEKVNNYLNELFELEGNDKLEGTETIKLIAISTIVVTVIVTIGFILA